MPIDFPVSHVLIEKKSGYYMGPMCWRSVSSRWCELYLSSAAARTGNTSHVATPGKLLAAGGSGGDASHLAGTSRVSMMEAGCQRFPAQAGCKSEGKFNDESNKVLKANFRNGRMKEVEHKRYRKGY